MNLLTAAHKTLQLPSLVKVTNIENNRSLILRVNDRGPFVKNRIIDVSKKAASILGFQKKGTANVIVEYYGKAKIYDKNGKIVKQKLTKNIKNDEGFYFVRIGIFSDILVVPEAMGLPYEMVEKKGPWFPKTIKY